jgi:Regulator of chromosome condensation (RCC1) repeat
MRRALAFPAAAAVPLILAAAVTTGPAAASAAHDGRATAAGPSVLPGATTAPGQEHSVALLSDGSVWVWGGNGEFQLARSNGFPGGISQSNVPIRVPGLSKAKAIAAGGSFSLAVVGGGRVRAWGDNAFGQLGNGGAATGPAPVTVTGLSGVSKVLAGGVTSLAFGPNATVTGSASPVTAVAGPVSSPWRMVGSPLNPAGIGGLKDVFFSSVAAGSTSDAWAVGASDALSTTGRPLAEHWDGHAWSTVAVPPPAGAMSAELDGVDEVSSGNVWAVGRQTTSAGAERTLFRCAADVHRAFQRADVVERAEP